MATVRVKAAVRVLGLTVGPVHEVERTALIESHIAAGLLVEVPSEDVPATSEDVEALQRYQDALTRGLSQADALDVGWPEGEPETAPEGELDVPVLPAVANADLLGPEDGEDLAAETEPAPTEPAEPTEPTEAVTAEPAKTRTRRTSSS